MKKMIQQLKYIVLIFSMFLVVCGIQASEYFDEKLNSYYTLTQNQQGALNVKMTATYDKYELVMIKDQKGALDCTYTVKLNDKLIAQKTQKGALKTTETGKGVANWKEWPFKMTEGFVNSLKKNDKSNSSNHPNQQPVQQQNNNQQPVIIKQQTSDPLIAEIAKNNMTEKINKNKKIILRIGLNLDRNNSGRIGSFENLDDLRPKQAKDNDFLFIELSTKHKDNSSSIDSIIHAVWLSWIINTGIHSQIPHGAQSIIATFNDVGFSVQKMEAFKDIPKGYIKTYYIQFLKDYKEKYVCNKNIYEKDHDCQKQNDCPKINVVMASKEQMLYLVANSIVHLICDDSYNLEASSEYEDLFTHIKNLKENTKYAFVLIIQLKNGSIIECLVNKEKNIEIVTFQSVSNDFKKFIKNLLGDSIITQNFLEKEIIRLEQKSTENVVCAQEILEKLGIEKDLIKQFIKIPEMVINETLIENPISRIPNGLESRFINGTRSVWRGAKRLGSGIMNLFIDRSNAFLACAILMCACYLINTGR